MSRSVSVTIARRLTPAGVGDGDGPLQLERWVTAHDSVAGGASGPLREGRVRSPSGCGSPASRSTSTGRSGTDEPRSRAGRRGAGGSRARVSYRLEAEDGGTRLDNARALSGGGLGKLAGGLPPRRRKREASRSLERLRTLLED